MRILYLCHRIPFPPDKGDKIRSFHQIRHLGRAHEVHVACLVDDPADRVHVEALRRHCSGVDAPFRSRAAATARSLVALAGGRPLSVAAFRSAALAAAVTERLRAGWPDAVIVFSSAMGAYVPVGCDRPVLVDFVDADSDKWRLYAERSGPPLRWIYGLEASRLGRFERALAARADASLFVSDTEARLLGLTPGDGRTFVVTNGVDLDYFRPGPEAPPLAAPRAVFVGMMDYYPNVDAVAWFAEEILPRVRRVVPDASFDIVGRRPHARVRALARLPGVRVTGGVPDVRAYLGDGAVAVAPFRIARGIQNKILEAMAMERPVVGSPSAFQGLPAGPGDGVAVAEGADAFASEVATLLRDGDARRDRGRDARRFVERNHRWEEHGRRLEEILDHIGARHAGGRAAARSAEGNAR